MNLADDRLVEATPSASIIKIHQDEVILISLYRSTARVLRTDKRNLEWQVWELPYGARIIATSDLTSVEAFSLGDHLLGIQGHPEYTKDILLNLVDRLASQNLLQVWGLKDIFLRARRRLFTIL